MNKIVLTDETLTDKNHEIVGWVADDSKFHPCGTALTIEQMKEIISIIENKE